jgi:L-iditol 2-dehydrogenase
MLASLAPPAAVDGDGSANHPYLFGPKLSVSDFIMRAAVLHGKEDVRIEEIPKPPLKPGEVRIGIRAALTCGTDLKVFKRGYHAKMLVPPTVFGHELAGEITEITPEAAERFAVGDRVVVANSAPCGRCFFCQADQENLCDDLLFLNGAYAESIAVPARIVDRNLLKLDDATPFRDAALTEPLACVVQGIHDLKLRSGERVLIIGAGPIGLMFATLAKETDCQVTVAGRGENRLAKARALGADLVLNAPTVDVLPELMRKHGCVFDAVVEAVGQPECWEAAVKAVRKGGRVNFFGGCPSGASVSLDTTLIHYSNLTLLASFHHSPRAVREALRWIERGLVRAADFVDGECALRNLPEQFRGMAAGNRAVKTFVDVSR